MKQRLHLLLITLGCLALLAGAAWPQTAPPTTADKKPVTKAAATKLRVTPAAAVPRIILLDSASPLYAVKIMVMAGSVDDPLNQQGLASLTAETLLEGGFGPAANPITKEKLAEITRPWGSAAMPSVRVDKQTTLFTMTVPKEAFPDFVRTVLRPMFSEPRFDPKELARVRTEQLKNIESRLRFEQQEMLGLQALESYVLQGTPLSPLAAGTINGLRAIERNDAVGFYRKFYTAHDVAIATNAPREVAALLKTILPVGSRAPQQMCSCDVKAPKGREVLIVTSPNAIATGVHLGFPLDLRRGDPDYWPLFVANVFLGAHRDDFGRLYQEIREARGYNYGDYSYIEYLSARPYALFPPPGSPRSEQYFSLWIRPVGHQYAHFVLKAATAELERFAREGLTDRQVAEAKVKARTLYLNYAESSDRRLGYLLEDTFYGVGEHGYLQEMLKNIDSVTDDRVNAVIPRYLQARNLRYVITTNEKTAQQLADDLANNTNCNPKTPAEYRMSDPVTPAQQALLDQDRQWIAYPLHIRRDDIHIVKAEEMFETAVLPGVPAAVPAPGAAQ